MKFHNRDVLDSNYKKAPYDQEVMESWYDAYNKRMMKLFMDDDNFIQINLKNQDSAVRIKKKSREGGFNSNDFKTQQY